MDFSAYPNLSFKLDSGRIVKVHAFIWEPSEPEILKIATTEGKKQLEIERNRFRCSDVIPSTKTHVVNWELVDEFVNHPPRCPNSVMNVLLSSDPLYEGAIYSELAVIIFMDYVEGISMEAILEKKLHDLDWEELANDVSDQNVRQVNEAWLDRAIH